MYCRLGFAFKKTVELVTPSGEAVLPHASWAEADQMLQSRQRCAAIPGPLTYAAPRSALLTRCSDVRGANRRCARNHRQDNLIAREPLTESMSASAPVSGSMPVPVPIAVGSADSDSDDESLAVPHGSVSTGALLADVGGREPLGFGSPHATDGVGASVCAAQRSAGAQPSLLPCTWSACDREAARASAWNLRQPRRSAQRQARRILV